ncbi:MAG: hypothetical protein ACWIPI_09165, partial [Polaribacter sp.]
LKKRLAKYETPKTSRNSSAPPSKDENRPKANQSLRKSLGKKSGIDLVENVYLLKTKNNDTIKNRR